MSVVYDAPIANTNPVNINHYPRPGTAGSTFIVACAPGGTYRVLADMGSQGYLPFLTGTLTSGEADAVVIDTPKIPVRLEVTPASASGNLTVRIGDANIR